MVRYFEEKHRSTVLSAQGTGQRSSVEAAPASRPRHQQSQIQLGGEQHQSQEGVGRPHPPPRVDPRSMPAAGAPSTRKAQQQREGSLSLEWEAPVQERQSMEGRAERRPRVAWNEERGPSGDADHLHRRGGAGSAVVVEEEEEEEDRRRDQLRGRVEAEERERERKQRKEEEEEEKEQRRIEERVRKQREWALQQEREEVERQRREKELHDREMVLLRRKKKQEEEEEEEQRRRQEHGSASASSLYRGRKEGLRVDIGEEAEESRPKLSRRRSSLGLAMRAKSPAAGERGQSPMGARRSVSPPPVQPAPRTSVHTSNVKERKPGRAPSPLKPPSPYVLASNLEIIVVHIGE